MTEDDVRALLRSKAPRQADFAKVAGISPQYVNDVLAGRRDPGKAILDALGIEKVVTYRRKSK